MNTKILMVCLGNICRSPLAEGILKSKLDTDRFEVHSAGTADYHTGKAPDPRSIAVAKANGLDISKQRATPFSPYDFDNFDQIFVMDNSNYKNVLAHAKNQSNINKVTRILDVLPSETHKEVPDPYYGGDQGFEHVYQLLDRACDHIATQLKNQ